MSNGAMLSAQNRAALIRALQTETNGLAGTAVRRYALLPSDAGGWEISNIFVADEVYLHLDSTWTRTEAARVVIACDSIVSDEVRERAVSGARQMAHDEFVLFKQQVVLAVVEQMRRTGGASGTINTTAVE